MDRRSSRLSTLASKQRARFLGACAVLLLSTAPTSADNPRSPGRAAASAPGSTADVDVLERSRADLDAWAVRLVSREADARTLGASALVTLCDETRRVLDRDALAGLYALGDTRFVNGIDQRWTAVRTEAEALAQGAGLTADSARRVVHWLSNVTADVQHEVDLLLEATAMRSDGVGARARCRLAARAAGEALVALGDEHASTVAGVRAAIARWLDTGLADARALLDRLPASSAVDAARSRLEGALSMCEPPSAGSRTASTSRP